MAKNFRLPLDYRAKTNKAFHDLSCARTYSIHTGLVNVGYRRHIDAGEKIKLNINNLLQSNSLRGPLMGAYMLRSIVVFDADANRYGWLDNNDRLTPEEILTRKKHTYVCNLRPSAAGHEWNTGKQYQSNGVARGSLWDFLGVGPGCTGANMMPVGPESTATVPFGSEWNIDFALTYLNAFRTYIANSQEKKFPVSRGVVDSYSDPVVKRDKVFKMFDLDILDKLFRGLRSLDDGYRVFGYYAGVGEDVPGLGSAGIHEDIDETDWKAFLKLYLDYAMRPHGGLLPCTYEPDIYRNLLNDKDGKVVSRVTVSSGEGGQGFTIDTLRFQNKLQRFLDRLDVSGGRMSDWLRTVWGVKTTRRGDSPDLLGAYSQLIDPSNIVSSADTEGTGGASIGQLGGYIDQFGKESRRVSFTASEPGNVMVLTWLVPLVDYCQNVEYDLLSNNFADDYNPSFAQLGFQSVPQSDYTGQPDYPDGNFAESDWFSINNPLSDRVGKQVAWLHKMTATNRVHGEFAEGGTRETWALIRRFTYTYDMNLGTNKSPKYATYKDFSTYVNPLDWQYPFNGTSLQSPNFFLNAQYRIGAVRQVGKRFMPTLE